MDSAASTLQPSVSDLAEVHRTGNLTVRQSQKSDAQNVGDAMSGNKNENQVHILWLASTQPDPNIV